MGRKLLQTAEARRRRARYRKKTGGKRGGGILTPQIMAAARAAKKAGRTSLSQAATRSIKAKIQRGSGLSIGGTGGTIRTAQNAPASYSTPAKALVQAGFKGAGRKLHMTMGMK